MSKTYTLLVLFCILSIGFILRIIGIEWDQGHHMHPDERAIILSVSDLSFPSSLDEFLSTESPWNPQFFAYGSFPFYLLRILGNLAAFIDPRFGMYDAINIVGRFLSALFDTGTILILYCIGRHLRDRTLGIVAAFLYAVSVLPIQLSHFYAVDTILTFFTTSILFLLLKLYEKPSLTISMLVGLFFGLSLATKISATVLLSSIGLSLLMDFLLIVLRFPHRFSRWSKNVLPTIKRITVYGTVICSAAVFTFLIAQPYALLDQERSIRQLTEQSHMTKDAFTFPYTLQYVGKIPYVYELKNIILFGLGPLLSLFSLSGFFLILYQVISKPTTLKWQKYLIILQFVIVYFLVTGSFAIGFMRYMLPLYPFLCLFGGAFIVTLLKNISNKTSRIVCIILLVSSCLVWPLSFMHIYTLPNTRILASRWIYAMIPEGKTLAVEHWDDQLPIGGTTQYTVLTLPMYESEHPEKWQLINENLRKTDYLIIASNRLYVPIMKLTDCEKLQGHTCYQNGAKFYKELFAGKRGFQKVAEFTVFPTIPLLNIPINDQHADESFTVYDHPKVMIFKNYHAQ